LQEAGNKKSGTKSALSVKPQLLLTNSGWLKTGHGVFVFHSDSANIYFSKYIHPFAILKMNEIQPYTAIF